MTLAAAFIFKVLSPATTLAGWRSLAPRGLREAAGAAWAPAAAEALVVLGLLAPGALGRAAAIAACLLLLAFAAALAAVVRRGTPAECGCFGSFSREPISRLSVLRTTSLALVAAVAVVAGWSHPGLVPALSRADASELATGVVGVALGILALALSVRLGQARSVAHAAAGWAPPVGAPGELIPRVEVVSGEGLSVHLADLRQGAGLVLLVVSHDCAACRELLGEIEQWQADLGEGARIRLVTSSARADFLAEHPDLGEITFQGSLSTRQAFGVVGTPAAVLLGADGRVATPVAHGVEEIRGLLAGTLAAVQAHSSPST